MICSRTPLPLIETSIFNPSPLFPLPIFAASRFELAHPISPVMESAPLIKAHDHARAASTATHTADTTVAINEHTRAAGEFANAAKSTTSVEALRTLKLLEQHHQRLSELLQAPLRPSTHPASENDSQVEEKDDAGSATTSTAASGKSDAACGAASEKSAPPMPTLTKQPRYPSRDLGASIASNLASARGIRSKYRSQPLNPSVSNTEAPGNMEAASRRARSRTKMQNMLENSDKPTATSGPEKSTGSYDKTSTSPQTTSSDEGFSRFYSAFGSIINRISAPLAFAGLPLISEDQQQPSEEPAPAPAPEPPVQKRNRLKPSPAVLAEPDLRKIYSKAALRAVTRDGQFTNDSFYVVPTSGHTASYASILTYADKEKRRMGASGMHGDVGSIPGDGDEDDFVDARESQVPPSLHHSPSLRKRGAGPKGYHHHNASSSSAASDRELANLVEELFLENKSLKDMLDKLSKRLHAFESMSQNSGMRLAESMRLMRPGSPSPLPPPLPSSSSAATATGGTSKQQQQQQQQGAVAGGGEGMTAVEETLLRENRELKEQMAALSRQNEDLEKNYAKVRANLLRYREKWDQLKAGAKARRAGNASASTSTSAMAAQQGGGGSAGAGAGGNGNGGGAGSEIIDEERMLRSPSLG
ncbi:hypothetical protein F4775DRAFT_551312 [Biscogniauxia sp. FL1348]|nr:hypothetical protein F4775DRAFT_551312 [Biscogniauxia sp. FL1348]